MAQQPKMLDGVDWGHLILLSVLWGGAFFFSGVAVREISPLTLVLGRVALAALLLLPLFWWRGHRLPNSFRAWVPFLMMGLLNNVLPFGLIFAGQTHITVGLSSIINAMTPLFTVLVMASFGEERLTLMRGIGVLLGLAGVVILRGDQGDVGFAQTLGVGLCAAATLSYGFAAVWGRRHLSDAPPLKSATCQLIGSSLIMLTVVSVVEQPWNAPAPSVGALWSMLALAFFGTAIAYLVFFKILVRAGAGNVMLVTLLIPVTALILGAVFLDETIQPRELLGALVIALGLLFIDGRAFIWLKRAARKAFRPQA